MRLNTANFPYKTILLTGGTGSLGQALARFILHTYEDVTLRIFSRGEHRQWDMREKFGTERIRYLIGDVRDYQRLLLACAGSDLVIHTAALKIQPLLEYNVYEGIATNILGTQNVVQAAAYCGVKHCIFISSDKAVFAQTFYGSSKYIGECLAIQANNYSPHATRYNVVRWGNVARSNGSVIPFWENCTRHGKILPLTSMDVTRFWISMEEAVQFVVHVSTLPHAGNIYVPHICAFRVVDLARAMLGKMENDTLDTDVKIIGLRNAEKPHEMLMTMAELERAYVVTDAQTYYVIPPLVHEWDNEPWQGIASSLDQPYDSETWPYRLGVPELRQRLRESL